MVNITAMLRARNITIKTMSTQQDIAGILLDKEAVKVSIDPLFNWTSGIKSPVYCDNRKMISFVNARQMIVQAFKQMIEEENIKFDVIGGTATAAIPWAAFLASELKMPMIYIRPEKKEHGAGKQIEGHLEENSRVLIVEDLISTGGSSVKAVEAVRDAGCEVQDVLAIVTWEIPKAITRFEDAAVQMRTLTDYTNIIGLAAERGALPDDKLDIVLKFKEDPAGWAEKMGL